MVHINNKRIVKNTALLYFRMLFTMLVGLYTSRVVLSSLGVGDYGLYNVVGGIVVILSFLNGAMASSTQRYMNVELGKENMDGIRKVYVTSMLIHLGVAAVVLVLAETVGLWFLNMYMNIPAERMIAANWVYQFSVGAFIVTVLSVPYNATIIAHEKMSAFAYISVIEVLFKLLVAILIGYAPCDRLIFYALLIFIVSIIVRLAYGVYCHRHFVECKIKKCEIDKSLLKNMLSFSSWTIFGNLAFVFHTQGIAIVINMFFGTVVNAAQGISNQVNSIVSGFVQNFTTAMKPQIVKSYAAGNLPDLHKLILSGSRLSFFLVLIFAIPIIIETPYLLSLWLKEVPKYTVIFIRFLLIITLFDSFNSLLNAAKGATGNIKTYMIVMTSVSILHLPLSWILFMLGLEPYYAMVVYLLLVVIMQILRIKFVCQAIGMSIKTFYFKVVIRCLIVALLAFFPPFFTYCILPVNFWTVLINCIIGGISCMTFIALMGLEIHERTAIKNIIVSRVKNIHISI